MSGIGRKKNASFTFASNKSKPFLRSFAHVYRVAYEAFCKGIRQIFFSDNKLELANSIIHLKIRLFDSHFCMIIFDTSIGLLICG